MFESKLCVCLVSPIPPPYGGIGHWTQLILKFAAIDNELKLIPVDTAPRWRDIDDIVVWKRIIGGSIQLVRDYIRFLFILLRGPQVIHLTTSGQLALLRDLSICLTARLLKIPVVYNIHFGRIPEMARVKSPEWRLISVIMRLTNSVIAITPATADAIKKKLPQVKIEYIPNPIDSMELSRSNITSADRRVVFYLGWIIPTKGIEELIHAWSVIDSQGWELRIAGPGNPEYINCLIQHYKPNNFSFVGELSHIDAMKEMASCDLFVLPSYTEGFPNVILEAMYYGKPIIATTVGAIPEILSDGCGILIEKKDFQSLRQALTDAMHDETLRKKLGAKASLKLQREYTIDIIYSRYKKLWRNLVK